MSHDMSLCQGGPPRHAKAGLDQERNFVLPYRYWSAFASSSLGSLALSHDSHLCFILSSKIGCPCRDIDIIHKGKSDRPLNLDANLDAICS